MATRLLPFAQSSAAPRVSAGGPARCWKRTAYGLALLLVGCAVAWLVLDRIYTVPDLLAVRRVQPGMTEDQVVAVFSARPTKDTPYQFNFPPNPMDPRVSETSRYWYCDAGIVRVVFRPDGRVKFAHYVSYGYQPNPTMVKVRTFLNQIGLGWLKI